MPPRSAADGGIALVTIVGCEGPVEALARVLARGRVTLLVAGCEPSIVASLQKVLTVPVHFVRGSVKLEPGAVYVVDPSVEVTLRRGELVATRPAVARSPVDKLLRAVAEEYGRESIAIVLGSNGTDGALGVKRNKEVGGLTIAQAVPDAERPDLPRLAIAGEGRPRRCRQRHLGFASSSRNLRASSACGCPAPPRRAGATRGCSRRRRRANDHDVALAHGATVPPPEWQSPIGRARNAVRLRGARSLLGFGAHVGRPVSPPRDGAP
jgi:hypothetical protein